MTAHDITADLIHRFKHQAGERSHVEGDTHNILVAISKEERDVIVEALERSIRQED